MYCPQCGSKNANDARFCLKCGAPFANLSVWESEQAAARRRTEILNGVAWLCSQFDTQCDAYNELRMLQNELTDLQRLQQQAWPTIVIILLFIPLLAIISTIGDDIIANLDYLAMAAILALPGVLTSVAVVMQRLKRRKRIPQIRSRISEIYQGIYEHYLTVPNNPFAFEYSDPYTLRALYEILRLGKADSVKEAINVLEMSNYQSAMLNMQGQLLEESKAAKDAAITAAVFAGVAAMRR